jgi:phospholipase C
MVLLHGDETITNVSFPMQTGPSPDDTWRIRVTLAASPQLVSDSENTIVIALTYTSLYPILTRSIPIAFLQQTFEEDWNTHNYIAAQMIDGYVSVVVDPELASYHHIPNLTYDLHTRQNIFSDKYVDIYVWIEKSNLVVSDIIFNIRPGKAASANQSPQNAAIGLTVSFVGAGDQPIYIQVGGELVPTVLGIARNITSINDNNILSVNIDNFKIDIEFEIINDDGLVSYIPSVNWDSAWSAIRNIGGGAGDLLTVANILGLGNDASTAARGLIGNYVTRGEAILASFAGPVGARITPWFLGAAYDVRNIRFNSTSSQPIPSRLPQGDILVDFVGTTPQPPPLTGVSIVAAQTATPTLTVTSPQIVNVTIGQAFSHVFTAIGGSPPYSLSLIGTPPASLTCLGMTLSGNFNQAALISVAAKITDASGAAVTQSLYVAANAADFVISARSALPNSVAGEHYVAILAAQGGQAPYAWSFVLGLDGGFSISSGGVISDATETLMGGDVRTATDDLAGKTTIIGVEAKDSSTPGRSAYQAFSLSGLDPPLFNGQFYVARGDGDNMWRPTGAAPRAFAGPPFPAAADTPAEPPTTQGSLAKIEHIVVLMMENRSFDHLLGYLSKEGGRTDIEGLKLEETGSETQYNYYNGRYYYPTRLTDTKAIAVEDDSPDHSYDAVRSQMTDNMMHFVSDYAKKKVGDDPDKLGKVMGYYSAPQLPVYDFLAWQFAVCDHWFCSHPGPTWPNRFVALTGDLNRDSYGEPEVDTPILTDFTPSEAKTLFDHLTDQKVSWVYFQQNASLMRAFTKYTFDLQNVREFDDPDGGFEATVRRPTDGLSAPIAATEAIKGATSVAAPIGLPQVTFVDPLFGDLPAGVGSPQDNDDAPPSDLKDGQTFVQNVLNILFTPEVNPHWQSTMLVIMYDEHGGFYDHVEPPDDFPPLLGQWRGKLGPRVPAFVVSPYTAPNTVLKDNFDHGSIAATILRRFCSPNPPFMSARVSAATDLRGALNLAVPRDNLLAPGLSVAGTNAKATEAQSGTSLPQSAPATRELRSSARPLRAPHAPDAFGGFLGGLMMTTGRTPRA